LRKRGEESGKSRRRSETGANERLNSENSLIWEMRSVFEEEKENGSLFPGKKDRVIPMG